MRHTLSLILASMALGAPLGMHAEQWGYCTDATSRNNIFRVGTSETQGMAIRLDKNKIETLKGRSITGVSVVFGSQHTTDRVATLFVGTTPEEPLTTKTVDISTVLKWKSYDFDTPYVITGDEDDLYIGYTAEISNKSSMLVGDYTMPFSGCSYVYDDGKWVDTYPLGVGNVSLRVNLADGEGISDIKLKPLDVEGYFKAGESYRFDGQIFNFGSADVHSFDLRTSVGNTTSTTTYTGLDLKQGEAMDFTLELPAIQDEGTMPVEIIFDNVNGGTDADPSDNAIASDMYYYPHDMERSLLLENFTGQYCSNCPGGHSVINSYIKSSATPVVEICHHAGFSPDLMTMDASLDYTMFYPNPMNTFAPAIMLNRHWVPAVSATPVINADASELRTLATVVERLQPYVSLSLDSQYDPATREVSVTVRTYAHTDLPDEMCVLNVMLCQNGIESYQSPLGTNYVHNAVFRGTLTGNTWGLLIDGKGRNAGGFTEWHTTFTLPEGIFADYYNWDTLSDMEREAYTVPVVVDNMYLVAYVAAYDSQSKLGHTVYNAVETPLGQSHTQSGMASISSVIPDAPATADIRVSGRHITVAGEYTDIRVYTLAGQMLDSASALAPGVYVVRVSTPSGVVSKKVAVK